MPSHFIFVDETGDLGPKGTPIFGFGLIQVSVIEYGRIREILAEKRWRRRLYRDFQIDPGAQPASNLLIQLGELANFGKVSASGFYINKARYKGKYLVDEDSTRSEKIESSHLLRNYLLRRALEFHYSDLDDFVDRSLDAVIDRIAVNADQRRNLEEYLSSHKIIGLSKPFRIPRVDYVTISDSSYTGALQLAHLVAEVLKKSCLGLFPTARNSTNGFIKMAEFLG